MPTFQKADKLLAPVADRILKRFTSHEPLLDAGVKIDFVFAYGDRNDDGELVSDALKQRGRRVYGLCRVLNLKDRAKGNGDAEIVIDHDHWNSISEDDQNALLDHELHHIKVKTTRTGRVILDDHDRPKLELRKHDVEFGWFNLIAERHGQASIEVQQAMAIYNSAGQLYFPGFELKKADPVPA